MSETRTTINPKMILFLLFSANIVSGMDRFIINFGILPITEEFQLSATQSGLILSTFFLGYALMQLPGGWLSDRFGPRIVILFSVFGFSIFTGLTGIAWSFAILVVIRFIFGLGEGSFFPAGGKLIADTIPEKKRSRAMSIFISALTVAGVISPLLATTLMVSIGWRWMFIIIGLCGIIIGLLNWYYLPKTRRTSQNQMNIKSVAHSVAGKGSYKLLYKNPMVWSLIIVAFSYGFIAWGLSAWMPTYLVNERGISFVSLGLLQMIPAVTGIIFILLNGQIVDRLKNGNEKWLGAISGLMLGLMVFLMFNAETVTGVIFYQSIIPIFQTALSVIIFSIPIKRLPEAIGGTALGVVNLGFQIAGFLAPLAIGLIVDAFDGSYTGVVWIMFSFGILACLSFVTLYSSGKKELNQDDPSQIVPVIK